MLLVFMTGCASTNNVEKTTDDSKTPTQVPAAKKDLASILDNMAKYSADYTITSKKENSVTKATLTYALPKFAMSTSIPEGDVKMIFDGTSIITCTNMENIWGCYKMTADKPESIKITESLKSGASKATIVGTCKQAGESGTKYQVDSDSVTSTVCFTNDGIILEMNNAETDMVATRVSRSVSDSDFTPPATPKDISSMFPNGVKQ